MNDNDPCDSFVIGSGYAERVTLRKLFMLNPKVCYVSYLLRLQQVQTDSRLIWVASVQNTATGEQCCFADLDAFVQFLQAQFQDHEIPLEITPDEQNPRSPRV